MSKPKHSPAAIAGPLPGDGPLFRFAAEPGEHEVGLDVVEHHDRTRSFRGPTDPLGARYGGERARPLQTLIWYPAKRSTSKRMSVADYLGLWATETSFDAPSLSAVAREWRDGMSPALALPMQAVRDADRLPGAFPVVIYAPSFSSPSWENADLCEYLASHGYVVLACPSMGETTRQMTPDLAGLDAQARDIAFLIGQASNLPNTDLDRIAVAGFSWGGLANMFAASRDNRISALVALDGSIRYWPNLVQRAEGVHPEWMTIPLLSFSKGEWTLEQQARYLSAEQLDGPNVLNAWRHGDLYSIHMLGMTHREFSSMFQRNEQVWQDFHDPDFADTQRADFGREWGIIGYEWVARYTLRFLDAYLKQDSSARAYLHRHPVKNGAPDHFMEVTHRAGRGSPPSLEGLRAEVGRVGFGKIAEAWAAVWDPPSFCEPDQRAVDAWAEELIDAGRFDEAVALLAFNAGRHPAASDVHASLARAQELAGKFEAAIGNYRKALDIDSWNARAKRSLRALEGRGNG